MSCDYYIKSDLVIIYTDSNNRSSKTITNRYLKKIYFTNIPGFDSDDDEENQKIKYNEELEKFITTNNYKKYIFNNEEWIKKSYKKRYLKELRMLCPGIVKIIEIYKKYTTLERNLDVLQL
jgi:hypothetical protein